MRLLEAAILLSLLPVVLGLFLPAQRRPRWLRYLPRLGVGLIALHLIVEGYRWQMIPAYALTAIFLLLSLRTLARPAYQPPASPGSRWRAAGKMAGAVAALVVFGLTALVPALLPVFELPDPTGSLRVGTTSFSLIDASRPETFTPDESDRRELLVQAWYPAEPTAESRPECLLPWSVARGMTRSLGLPRFLFDHLALVESHSHRDAALSTVRATYPVLVFSHGYLGTPAQNTVQMEELASHGYIVFSIGHSYEAGALLHPDGRIVAVSDELLHNFHERTREPDFGALLWQLLASGDAEERARLLQENSEADSHFAGSVEIWSADTSFLFDELRKLNGAKALRRFTGRLDLDRIGVFGMSFGGAAAADVCLNDSRCRAGINMDGVHYGAAALRGSALKVPFMFMTSEPFSLLAEPVFRRTQAPAWRVTVNGSTHLNFTDKSLFSPLFRTFGLTGPIDGERMEEIMNVYIRAFFDRHLAGQDSPLLKGQSVGYPEVTLQTRMDAAS